MRQSRSAATVSFPLALPDGAPLSADTCDFTPGGKKFCRGRIFNVPDEKMFWDVD